VKLSDLKPCAVCGGPLPPIWRVVRVSLAALDREATNGVLGVSQMMGGLHVPGALAIAEALAPASDQAVMVLGDKDKSMMDEFNICQGCFLTKPIDLALLQERAGG
jgi:hypothetical protein